MDPNANIEELLRLAQRIRAEDNTTELKVMTENEVLDAAERMSELVLALDEWLVKGGFMPQRWQYAGKR